MTVYIFTLFLLFITVCRTQNPDKEVHYLEQGSIIHSMYTDYPRGKFQVFCYEGKPKYIIHVWQSVVLRISPEKDNYVIYEGSTPDQVLKEYEEHRTSWVLNLFSWKRTQIKLNPFNQSCIGIYSDNNYKVNLHVIRIDYWKVLLLICGIMLFLSADRLSRNTLFYYVCGVSAGIGASFLILIYFGSKLLPKKPMMYGMAAAGWTVGVFLIQLIWDNLKVILMDYKIYVAYYAISTGIISFVVCYRWGPIENERTRNIIKWSLQALGLLAIFCSSHFQEAAMGQIVILLILYNTPKTWLSKPQSFWKKRFPPKVRLLSSDEYYEQGVRETSKALNDLRKYCSSPDCNQWKTALQLKDVKRSSKDSSRSRFASFIEGNSHLSDDEVLEYETSFNPISVTDDEEEEYTDEED